jgi:hypothetical protein
MKGVGRLQHKQIPMCLSMIRYYNNVISSFTSTQKYLKLGPSHDGFQLYNSSTTPVLKHNFFKDGLIKALAQILPFECLESF